MPEEINKLIQVNNTEQLVTYYIGEYFSQRK